jgi:hypothetical protein
MTPNRPGHRARGVGCTADGMRDSQRARAAESLLEHKQFALCRPRGPKKCASCDGEFKEGHRKQRRSEQLMRLSALRTSL